MKKISHFLFRFQFGENVEEKVDKIDQSVYDRESTALKVK